MAPFYVALCHIRPRAGLTEPVMEKLATMIKSGGGIVRKVNNSGIRPLPTEMHGKGVAEFHKFASIATVEFAANPQLAVSAIQQIRGLDDVVRINLLRADDILLNQPPRQALKPIRAAGSAGAQQASSSNRWRDSGNNNRGGGGGGGGELRESFPSKYDRPPSNLNTKKEFPQRKRISFVDAEETMSGIEKMVSSQSSEATQATTADSKIIKGPKPE